MRSLALPCVLLVCVLALQFEEALSECCYPNRDCVSYPVHLCTKCGDGTRPTPYCGYGKCNMFGCNCDGGCRKAYRFRRQAEDHFAKHDRDGDGKISHQEAHKWLTTGLGLDAKDNLDEFRKLDSDGDGHLTRKEIGA